MNYHYFIITASASFIAGIGLGLVIKDLWAFLTRHINVDTGNSKMIKSVKFSKYFETYED